MRITFRTVDRVIIDMDAEPRTNAGLTLLEAEQRIDALELAAAKVVVQIADQLKDEVIIEKHGKALLDCVYVLFEELRVEGLKHSEFVESSLAHTASAVDTLQRSIRETQLRRTS